MFQNHGKTMRMFNGCIQDTDNCCDIYKDVERMVHEKRNSFVYNYNSGVPLMVILQFYLRK